MNNEIIIWKCKECGDIQISNPRKHHCMDVCKCGKTGVDLEDYLMRSMGSNTLKFLKQISFYEMDIMSELLINCLEQGHYLELDKKYIELTTFFKLEEIERDILLDLI